MPWHVPEDLTHFREVTSGCPVVMGRRTWESLPPRFRPLPGRHNIVVTRQTQWAAQGAEVAASLPQALERARAVAAAAGARQVCVLGGGEVYAQALPLADGLELTLIDRDFEGTTRFPQVSDQLFEIIRSQRLRAAAPNDFDLEFVTWRRRAGPQT
jgi:dihydrofolate reductase